MPRRGRTNVQRRRHGERADRRDPLGAVHRLRVATGEAHHAAQLAEEVVVNHDTVRPGLRFDVGDPLDTSLEEGVGDRDHGRSGELEQGQDGPEKAQLGGGPRLHGSRKLAGDASRGQGRAVRDGEREATGTLRLRCRRSRFRSMATPEFARLPGFRDFPPEEMALRAHVFDAWKRVAQRYAFREYDGPPLEALELYTEKSGEEIVGQLYAFTDRGDRRVAMRPEMTPSLARILADRSRAMPKPIRWFSTPQLFRYERQQRGRLREHFQWNVDIVGEAGVAADAEVLAVALDGLRELGLGPEDVRARVSDRRLLAAVLRGIGVADDRLSQAYAVIDKVERQPRERSLQRLVDEAGLGEGAAESLLALLESPGIEGLRTAFPDDPEVGDALDRFESYLEQLAALGFGDFIDFDLRIVRGLAYYTGIVFEVFDARGELRAVCGGGRYDRLLELVGGQPLPAVGFGMGDVVLTELLRDLGRLPDVAPSVDYFIAVIGEELRPRALELAGRLRRAGHSVAYPLKRQAVRKQFKAAETEGALEVVVLAPDEVARGEVVVRDMRSGAERIVSLDDFGEVVEGDDA